VIGGYWMIQVKSKEEAVEWASRCPASDNEVIELRQVQEFADFPSMSRRPRRGFRNCRGSPGARHREGVGAHTSAGREHCVIDKINILPCRFAFPVFDV
jgi:hypothetical protein